MEFIFGLGIVIVLLFLILSKKVSALSALIVVPLMGSLMAGYGFDTFEFAINGVKKIAPVATMFIFAILFFGILTDAGLFEPIIRRTLKVVGRDPVKITMGSAILAMIVHLDGSGAITFLIVIPAMLPLFQQLGMDKKVLATVVALGAGTMNMVPWGGPTLRAATALNVNVMTLYKPLIIPQIIGLSFVLLIAYWLGRREARKLLARGGAIQTADVVERSQNDISFRRPQLFWINALLVILVLFTLIKDLMPPALIFMLGTVVVLTINYPKIADQRIRIDAHAKSCLLMASILLAAGVFTGIMQESGMISAMADQIVKLVPVGMGSHIPAVVSILSMPLSLFFDPDSFYFGFLPVISEVSESMGIPGASVAQASLLGQMTTGFPISPLTPTTFLLVGLAGIDLADHQRHTFIYALFTTLVMSAVCIILGIYPL